MADEASNTPNPFDVGTIKNLITLMSRHDLSEIDLRDGEQRIRLRRGPHGTVLSMPSPPTPAPAATPAPTAAPTPSPAPTEPAKPSKPQLTIKSPTPGTFYTSPSPGAPPFVKVGARVTPTTVVCIIEAMKILNELQAECSGVITEICVENQQPVEYGQVLFKVDPTG